MTRAFRFRNFSVYVFDERGAPHHRPHAHVKNGRSRVASIYLETLDIYDVVEPLPKDLVRRVGEEQEALVALWIRLNEEDE